MQLHNIIYLYSNFYITLLYMYFFLISFTLLVICRRFHRFRDIYKKHLSDSIFNLKNMQIMLVFFII